MRYWPVLIMLCLPAAAVEKAAYDSNGRIIALLSQAEDIEAVSNLVAVLPSGKRIPIQLRRSDRRGVVRQGRDLAWSAAFELPDGSRGQMNLKAEEDAAGVRYSSTVTAETLLDVDAIEFVLDLPRKPFLNGRVTPEGGDPVPLAAVKPGDPALYRGEAAALRFENPGGEIALDIRFGASRMAAVVDRWDPLGRSYQLRVPLRRGAWAPGASTSMQARLGPHRDEGAAMGPPAR